MPAPNGLNGLDLRREEDDMFGPAEHRHVGNSAYREDWMPAVTFRMRLLGATQREIAAVLGVSEQALLNWLKTQPALRRAHQRGGIVADAEVAAALYKRALGYDYTETKAVQTEDGDIVEVPVTRHMPPDVGACKTWLTCRQSTIWKERRMHEHADAAGKSPLPAIMLDVIDAAAETEETM